MGITHVVNVFDCFFIAQPRPLRNKKRFALVNRSLKNDKLS
jgi:hypothetical protein